MQGEEFEQLLGQGKAEKVLELIGTTQTQTEEEKYLLGLFKIRALITLNRIEDVLGFINESFLAKSHSYKKEVEQAGILLRLSKALLSQNKLDEAINILDLNENILKAVKNPDSQCVECLGDVFHQKGLVFWQKGDFEKSYIAWKNALKTYQGQEPRNEMKVAALLNNMGLICQSKKGDSEEALKYHRQSLEIYGRLGEKGKVANTLNNIGHAFRLQGQFDKALDHYFQSRVILKELAENRTLLAVVNNIGEIYLLKGELDNALEYYQECIEIVEKTKDEKHLAVVFENIGKIHFQKGELELALDYIQRAMTLREKLGNTKQLAFAIDQKGLVYRAKGDYEKAYECFSKSLDLNRSIGNAYYISNPLFNICILTAENDKIKESLRFLQELEEITKGEKNKLIYQRCHLARATILKSSNRILKRAKAQQFFIDVVNDEVVDHELTVYAMLNLCQMLLSEVQLQETEEEAEEVLSEINDLVRRLLVTAREQGSFSLLVRTYSLQSKLALIRLDFDKSKSLLSQARILAEEKGLWGLAIVLSSEEDFLRQQMKKWNEILKRGSKLVERVKLARPDGILIRMIKNFGEDITQLPQFAVDHIKVSLFKLDVSGPDVLVTEALNYTDNPTTLLYKIALFYSVSLGQGDYVPTGLYGPLPVPKVPGYIGIIYSFFIKDPMHRDKRCKEGVYTLLVFTMPQSLAHFYNERGTICLILENELRKFDNIDEIDLEAVLSIKYSTLGLEYKKED